MGISHSLKDFFLKTMPGMNNKFEDLDLQDKWVEEAFNCRFEEEPGAVDKRDPVTYYNSSSTGSGAVTGLYRFYRSDGTIVFIKVHDTSAYVGDDASGTWTEIRANLTQGKRMAFTTYKDLCIMGNGFDNLFVYDGSSDNVTWELGSCKAVLGSGAGNLDSNAEYYYAVTFDDDAVVNGAVSNVVTTDGTNQRIELSNIPLGPVGTTNRKIYRTEGDGSALKLVATIADNTTTVYSDNIADGSLGTAYPAVTDDMPKGSILNVHRERLFISGDPNNANKIYYSNVYLPHYIQQSTNSDYMEISPEDGDEIMGIPILLGSMICIKKNTIRKLHISSAVSGADPGTWYADDPIAWVGSPAQWSITQTPYGIVFLGWDHWYRFDGSQAEKVMDEFDTGEILASSYYDVVGFWHKGIFLAAYSDKTIAAQYHNRIMRYNLHRSALSIDYWTSTTLSGANCFAARTGDDETGELYFGDSQNGYVVKQKLSEDTYRLRTKNECNSGAQTNVFVGGLESSPYIEIGSSVAASAIPNDICIFWDSSTTTPGTGWTEVDIDGRLIMISTTNGTQSGTSVHNHDIDGTLETSTAQFTDGGDSDGNSAQINHSHTVGSVGSPVSEDSEEVYPRHTFLRIFKKNASTTEYEFPTGAIVLWDQPTPPTGWLSQDFYEGHYIRGWDGSSNLSTEYPSSHGHDMDIYSDYAYTVQDSGGTNPLHEEHAPYPHRHQCIGELNSADMSSWELDYVGFSFIKKVSDSDTWDGIYKYVYALYDSAGTPGAGWEDRSSVYANKFLKCLTGEPSTGSASGSSHDHIIDPGTSEISLGGSGLGGYHHQMISKHTHAWDLTSSEETIPNPRYRTFRLFRKVLGQMIAYNDGILTQYTAGTWISPAQQINAETMDQMFWNERITDTVNDNILFYTRSGSTQSACEAAAWSSALTDPNGSTIATAPNAWFQYKIEFSAADTRDSNPRVYFADTFVVKYTYFQAATNAESLVAFKYHFGFRDFDEPIVDKIFKRVVTTHEGTEGSFVFDWETENSSNSFTVDLSVYNERWESFFQDTAYGRKIDFTISKNDLSPYRLSSVKGFYAPQPSNY